MNVKKTNVAYDLSLFEEKKQKESLKDNVVILPKGKLERNKRRKLNPLAALTTGILFSLGAGVVGTMIFNQVQLTELTENINVVSKQLSESESVYTQLQVNMESKFSLDRVEDYARENLQMQKAAPASVQYVTLSQGDKAQVSIGSNSILDKILGLF